MAGPSKKSQKLLGDLQALLHLPLWASFKAALELLADRVGEIARYDCRGLEADARPCLCECYWQQARVSYRISAMMTRSRLMLRRLL